MQFGSAFLALFFMLRTVRFLAGHVAILDQLASRARFETIAALAASGTLRRHSIILSGCAHSE